MLASDCLILARSCHFPCMAVKKTGLHVSSLVWGSIFFDISFKAISPPCYFWRDNNILFPCFLFFPNDC